MSGAAFVVKGWQPLVNSDLGSELVSLVPDGSHMGARMLAG